MTLSRWEKVPFYTVNDRMPLGHGPKSAMIIKQYINLTNQELYSIWHHMGFNGDRDNDAAVGQSIEQYPAVLALQTADMMASRFMESEQENRELFADGPAPDTAGEWADVPATGEPDFQEAPSLMEGT